MLRRRPQCGKTSSSPVHSRQTEELHQVDPSPRASRSCIAVQAGTIAYAEAWELQKRLHARVAAGDLPGVLLLLEHPHVFTLGRRGELSHVLANREQLDRMGATIHHVDRGGEVTYHGPGQLVGYPIVDLRRWGGGPLRYVRALEEVLVATLAEFGIPAQSDQRPTGVWVGASKIAAIGVKISRGVTTHGFALNVAPDLSYFDHIVPCGMPDVRITSMAAERPEIAAVGQVVQALVRHFARVFGVTVQWATSESLGQAERPATATTP